MDLTLSAGAFFGRSTKNIKKGICLFSLSYLHVFLPDGLHEMQDENLPILVLMSNQLPLLFNNFI